MRELIAVVGAGTMGSGIAQIGAVAGHPVQIYDAVPGAAQRAVDSVRQRVDALVAKEKLDVEPGALRLVAAVSLADMAAADFVVEAVAEDLAIKRQLFADLERVVGPTSVLATNTSSLSPTALANGLDHPERVIGMHFFNPVPPMRLVEVVPGLATDPAVVDKVTGLAQSWGKSVVRSAATPGFIVNRVARPYYAEALRLYEERAADPATIDAVLVGAGGFRMGPFALMDLIGHDVNEAVTRSVWTAFGHDPRFAPSLAQRALVEAGWLGRKTSRGFYHYGDAAAPLTLTPLPECKPPAEVVELGVAAELSALLDRAQVPVLRGYDGDGVVELPSGTLVVRCTGVNRHRVLASIWPARRRGGPRP